MYPRRGVVEMIDKLFSSYSPQNIVGMRTIGGWGVQGEHSEMKGSLEDNEPRSAVVSG